MIITIEFSLFLSTARPIDAIATFCFSVGPTRTLAQAAEWRLRNGITVFWGLNKTFVYSISREEVDTHRRRKPDQCLYIGWGWVSVIGGGN